MIDHLGVQVADVDGSLAWYLRAFGPIGLREALRFPVEEDASPAPAVTDGKGTPGGPEQPQPSPPGPA